jgi:aminopeptidase N
VAVTKYAHWTAPYVGLDGATTMDVHYWSYPSDSARAVIDWSRNIEMMQFYAGLFGEYPFLTEKYAIAEFSHSGAMEHQTATSYSSGYVNGQHNNDYIVVHELAHSWVGDMITMTEWSHAWCKEGFATLCEALYFESLYGTAYYHTYMDSLHPLSYGAYQLFNISPPLSAAIYYKGAWVLHMLRHVIGDADFFQGIYDYTNDPDLRYGTAVTEDLRDAFQAASGMDLVRFFDQWIYHPGYPTYDLGWSAAPAGGGYDLTLRVAQVQDPPWPIFAMPIDVAVDTDLGQERFVIGDSLPYQEFSLHVAGSPSAVVLDPDGWLIKTVTTTTAVAAEGVGMETGVRCWPNPSRAAVTLRFAPTAAGPARLSVYDVLGRPVRRLVDGTAGPAAVTLQWDGADEAGRPLPAGVYFHRLETAQGVFTGRLVLLR